MLNPDEPERSPLGPDEWIGVAIMVISIGAVLCAILAR